MGLSLLDICLPDYFRGYHKAVLQVPVHKEMTKQELIDSLIMEYNTVWDYLEKDWPEMTNDELKEKLEDFIIKDMPFQDDDIPSLKEYENDDCMDSVYIYIVYDE